MGQKYWCNNIEYDEDEHRMMCTATRVYFHAKYNRSIIDSKDYITFANDIGHPWNGRSTFYVDFPGNEKLNNLLRVIASSDQPLTIIKIYRLQNEIDA